MTKPQWLAGLAAVIALATFFRAYQLPQSPPGLFFDEAANGVDALHAIQTGQWLVFYPRNGGREGLFINVQGLLLRVTGVREPWVLRSASAIFGVLTVWGAALLGRELFSEEVGLIGAFLMAVGFWHVNFSRIGLRAISAPCFLVWALFLLMAARKKGSTLWALAAGVVYGLGFHTYVAYRITPVIFGFGVIFLLNRGRGRVAAVIGAVVAALPMAIYFRVHPADFLHRVSEVAAPSATVVLRNAIGTFGMLLVRGDTNWRHNVSGSPELWLPVGLLFLSGLFFCRGKNAWLLPIWLVAGALPAILSEGAPHALRSILMIPPAYMIAAVGFMALYRMFPRKAAAAVVLAAIAVQGYVQYFVVWRNDARVRFAFGAKYLAQAYAIREAARKESGPIHVVAGDLGVGDKLYLAQPAMFIAGTDPDIHYIPEGEESSVPPGGRVFRISP